MAVFMVNICKYNGCGLIFPSLVDLIQHIEDSHIEYDPRIIEQKELQQPVCLPLSHVLRFFTDAARKEGCDARRKLVQSSGTKTSCAATAPSNTPTGSEADEDELITESEDSNDSWTTSEEFSAEFIFRYGSRMLNNNNNVDKPFACPVPGCKKRYKNVNGIKYHSRNGHKKDGKVRKGFKCHCGKSYKTCQGLRNHTSTRHSGTSLTTLTTQSGEVLQIPASHVAALQPFRAVALKHVSAIGLPVKTIQGLVLTTKPTESGNIAKSGTGIEGKFGTISFAKGSTIKMAMPPAKGSAITGVIVNNAVTDQETLTTALGVLTPATSPQTPPDLAKTSITPASGIASSQSSVIETQTIPTLNAGAASLQ